MAMLSLNQYYKSRIITFL